MNWDLSWPWLTLGNGFAGWIKWIQWFEFTGVLGGSVWILLINILIFQIIKNKGSKPLSRDVALVLIVLAIPASWSVYRYYTWKEVENPLNVVVLQPNIDPYNEKFSGMSSDAQLDQLSDDDRLLLLKFVCAFAWTDLTVTEGERRFVERLMNGMDLSENDRQTVNSWLDVAPPPSTIEADQVPPEHRRGFVEAVRALIYADGEVDAEERERFEKLKAGLRL
jgi:uncharacterized tellurite resistance protein B-like protein